MPRFCCICLPDLATDRAVAEAPDRAQRGAPLVLTRAAGSALFVTHACPRARAARVRPGLSLAEARAICPDLVARPHDAARDAMTLEHLALWAQRFSPAVESAPPDSLLLDVSGCARLFRGENNIVRQAVADLAAQRFAARAAIADSVGAAWALAHAGDRSAFVAPPGQSVPHLVGLPPAALRLDAPTVQRLDALGIRTIGDLLMLPTATLPARFGDALVLRIRQALGEAPEPVYTPQPAAVFAARMAFGPSDQCDVLHAALDRVVAALHQRLVAGGVAARRLMLVVTFEKRPPVAQGIDLARPSRDASHLRRLLADRLDTIDLSVAAAGLMVHAAETAVWRAAQGDLFDDPDRPDDEALAELIDRLALHLGGGAVVRAELVDDHQPERAFRYVPVIRGAAPERPSDREKTLPPTMPTARNSSARRPRAADAWDRRHDPPRTPPGRRPLILLARPRSIRVLALVPDGPPTWFRDRDREYAIAQAAGPERLETGWWRQQDIRRDYFRVTTTGGQQFWIYRDLDRGDWFLHGSYE